MAGLVYLVVVFLQLIILAQSTHTPRMPSSFNFSTLGVLAANGSSAVGGCASVAFNRDRTSTCNDPSSSVLFDGNIPTLAALDGDTWASQLMILYTPEFTYSSFSIYPSFSSSFNRRVEVTIFNCPQWGTGVETIYVQYRRSGTDYYRSLASVYPTVISCTSLLKVCIPFPTTASYTSFRLSFALYSGVKYVHIAEIAFYSSSTSCPVFTTIPGNWTPSPPDIQNTTRTPHSTQTEGISAKGEAQGSLQVEFKDSSLVSVVAVFATIMTFQTTVIFIVVIVIACKRKNSTAPREKLTTTTTTDNIGGVYETVDLEMAPEYPGHGRNDHGYGHERGKGIEFKKNESYEIPQ